MPTGTSCFTDEPLWVASPIAADSLAVQTLLSLSREVGRIAAHLLMEDVLHHLRTAGTEHFIHPQWNMMEGGV